MGKKGKGGGGTAADRQRQYFKAVQDEKLDTIRWSIRHGGLSLTSRDPASLTGLHVAAVAGKRRSLGALLDFLPRGGPEAQELAAESLDCVDDEGRTPLILAALKGHAECVDLLVEAGAAKEAVDDRGKTARAYAASRKYEAVVKILDGVESESEEEEEAKPKRTWVVKKPKGRAAKPRPEAGSDGEDGDGEAGADGAGGAPEPVWPEVGEVLAGKKKEVCLVKEGAARAASAGGADPALWFCKSLNRLELRCGLTQADGVGRLTGLFTLILTGNELAALPAEVGLLKGLKFLQIDGNFLKELPEALGQLANLESVSVNDNQLTSLAPLSPLEKLDAVHAARNCLDEVDMELGNKGRLKTLNLSGNVLDELPEGIGRLGALTSLNVSDCGLEELPAELGDLKENKLKEIVLDANDFDDPKINKLVKNGFKSKELLGYLRKQKGKGKKGQKKGKKAKKGGDAGDPEEDAEAKRKAKEEAKARKLREAEERALATADDQEELREKNKAVEERKAKARAAQEAEEAARLKLEKLRLKEEQERLARMTPEEREEHEAAKKRKEEAAAERERLRMEANRPKVKQVSALAPASRASPDPGPRRGLTTPLQTLQAKQAEQKQKQQKREQAFANARVKPGEQPNQLLVPGRKVSTAAAAPRGAED